MSNGHRPRVRLTVNNANHKALENGEAVEDLIGIAAEGRAALQSWIAQGGDLNVRAGKPRDVTALHALARLNSGSNGKSGRVDRAALCALLDAGADHTLKNRRGETPFHRAVALGIVWMAEEYVRRGLDDWEAVDSKGRTPLEACKDPRAILVLKAMGTQRKMERDWLPPTEPRPGLKPRL